MKTPTAPAICLAAALAAECATGGDTKTFFGTPNYLDRGSFPGGAWDIGNATGWSTDDGTTLGAWTSADDVARLQMWPSAWGSITMSIDNSMGAVSAKGVIVDGDLPNWTYLYFKGDTLRIGEGGFYESSANENTFVYFDAPVALTASQTWMTRKMRAMSGFGTVIVNGRLSSDDATTVLTLDGAGLADPAARTLASIRRPGFRFCSGNALSGPIRVRNGGMLWLSFTNDAPRLPTSQSLILEGGGVWATGKGSSYTQELATVAIGAGQNIFGAKDANVLFKIGDITRIGIGGTLDLPVNWNGGASAHYEPLAANSLLGGWATLNGTMWAKGAATGIVGGDNGIQRAVDNWADGTSIQANSGGTRTKGDVAPLAIRFVTDQEVDLNGATVTIQNGGLIAYDKDVALTGGAIRRGMDTGELFVHADSNISISSTLADNGATPGVLVKCGKSALTLSGGLAFSGAVYLNGGSLAISAPTVLSNDVFQAGGTTLRIEGGTLAPAARLSLGGNLALGAGARLVLPIQPVAPLALGNRAATLSQDPGAAVSLSLTWPDGADPAKGVYPLVTWEEESDVSSLDLSLLSPSFPMGTEGTLSIEGNALVLSVTRVPPKGTFILVM